KPRAQSLPWSTNPQWTWKMVQKLQEDPLFRRGLFSDSVADAKKSGCAVVKSGSSKISYNQYLAEYIF
ncbi:hypothetical protein BS47DRAFT_1279145, partial [Hydnum rufescens UP504]